MKVFFSMSIVLGQSAITLLAVMGDGCNEWNTNIWIVCIFANADTAEYLKNKRLSKNSGADATKVIHQPAKDFLRKLKEISCDPNIECVLK